MISEPPTQSTKSLFRRWRFLRRADTPPSDSAEVSTQATLLVHSWWRKALAFIAVALLSVPSAVGVFRALEPTRGTLAAGLAAAGFEAVYLATAILQLSPGLHRFAQRTALSAVSVAVLLNSIADYSLRTAVYDAEGSLLRHGLTSWATAQALFDPLALGLSIVESLPLAALAYAMATLLHRLAVEEAQAVQTQQMRVQDDAHLREAVAQREREVAQLRAEHAQLREELHAARATVTQHTHTAVQQEQIFVTQVAQLQATLAERDTELARWRATAHDHETALAQVRTELAQIQGAPVQVGELDLRAIAAALREPHSEPRSWRQIESLIKTPHSTIRNWLTVRGNEA